MPDDRWTPLRIETRLEQAASVIRRLPEQKVRGYFNTWPQITPEFSDLVGREPRRLRLPPPSPRAIDQAWETMTWLRWLKPDDAKIIWMRAENHQWKIVCRQVGLSRTCAWERWVVALCVISLHLNGERVPKHSYRLKAMARAMRRSA